MLVKFKFEKVKECVVGVYNPSEQDDDDEYETFQNKLNNVLRNVNRGFRVNFQDDMNGWRGNRKKIV